MSKKEVMCCNIAMLRHLPAVTGTTELRHIYMERDIVPEQIQFLDRKLVDAEAGIDPDGYALGKENPQILPYVLIRYKGEYLSYTRKGTETRLHDMYSIGIGGHIDIEDAVTDDVVSTIIDACMREMEEEAGLTGVTPKVLYALLSTKDEVGLVHAGFIAIIDLEDVGKDKSDITPKEELINPKWKKIDELVEDLEYYEDWSAKLIGWLKRGIIL